MKKRVRESWVFVIVGLVFAIHSYVFGDEPKIKLVQEQVSGLYGNPRSNPEDFGQCLPLYMATFNPEFFDKTLHAGLSSTRISLANCSKTNPSGLITLFIIQGQRQYWLAHVLLKIKL